MNTSGKIGAWCFTLVILITGVLAVTSRHLTQGKGIYVVGRLEGNAAVLLGGIMIAIGLYFVWLLIRGNPPNGGERSGRTLR